MLPNGGNRPPLSMADINGSSGFSGRGNNLNAYRGTLFYRPDNSTGYFSSGAINISDFYSTQGTSPVVPGNSGNITSGSTYTLPVLFNKLYVTCYGGGGGGGGGSYQSSGGAGYNGGAGSTGETTLFMPSTGFQVSGPGGNGGGGAGISSANYLYGVYVSGTDGTGSAGAAGSGGGGGAGGGGGGGSGGRRVVTSVNSYTDYAGATGGAGGAGGNSGEILIMDIDSMGWNAIRAYYGASIAISIGGGGGGGGGAGVAGNGNTGSSGRIYIRWT